MLKEHGVTQSMSRAHCCIDNGKTLENHGMWDVSLW